MDVGMLGLSTDCRHGITQMRFCVWSVSPRRLVLTDFGILPKDLLSFVVDRKAVVGPKPYLASAETSCLMVSIEETSSTTLGSVSPSSCQRIFGLWEDFFFPAFRLFQTEARFIDSPSVEIQNSRQLLSEGEQYLLCLNLTNEPPKRDGRQTLLFRQMSLGSVMLR
jgi:hypothetical protein